MYRFLLVVLFLLFYSFQTASAGNLKLTSIQRVFKHNGEWRIKSSEGDIALKNIFKDGSEWRFTLPSGEKYTVKKIGPAPNNWKIYKGEGEGGYISESGYWISNTLETKTSFSDYNEWQIIAMKNIYTKTVFKDDFSKWEIITENGEDKAIITAAASDKKEWIVKDGLTLTNEEKLLSAFVLIFTANVIH